MRAPVLRVELVAPPHVAQQIAAVFQPARCDACADLVLGGAFTADPEPPATGLLGLEPLQDVDHQKGVLLGVKAPN